MKGALKIWMNDRKLAADPAASPVDLLSGRATNFLERRKAGRLFDQMIDAITTKIAPIVEIEYRSLPENEQIAALLTVEDTFNKAALTDDDLFSQDLNAGYLDRYLRSQVVNAGERRFLSDDGRALFDLLLRECCELLIQVTMAMPPFTAEAVVQLLRRDTEIIQTLRDVLERLPARTEGRRRADFEVSYRRQVSNALDRMELFGVTLSEGSSRYPLSVAYISLSVSEKVTDEPADDDVTSDITVRVESALVNSNRILLRGEAGSGKTTLLKWIAVRSALRDFDGLLVEWQNTVPFFVPLRRYANEQLPTPSQFLADVGRHIADEMPQGWVQQQLREGKAIVLIDGVDEMPARQRDKVREWLRELLSIFPEARYIVTSRSAAVSPKWLTEDGFIPLEVQPMTPGDIKEFVQQWHEALRSKAIGDMEKERLTTLESRLSLRIVSERHLRILAETPLLCALICALHHDRRGQLPQSRMEVYDIALEMLLERRDAERDISATPDLSRTDKMLLLQDIAYWLIRNGQADEARDNVVSYIDAKLASMPQITADAGSTYRHLLERSGIIREPIVGHVDFVHKTFQEYLAALDLLSKNDIGLLIKNAHLDEWREVFIMAVGHAYTPKREELFTKLLARADAEPTYRHQLNLLAVASLATSPELSAETRDAIRSRVRELLPPKNITMAKTLAAAGEFVLDLLNEASPTTAREVAATIRAASMIGTESALQIIARFRDDARGAVIDELVRAWAHFDPEDYARLILGHADISWRLEIVDHNMLPALRYIRSATHLDIRIARQPADLRPLAHLKSLASLHLSGAGVTDLSPLASLGFLKSIFLGDTEVTDLSPLANLPLLTQLTLAENDATDLSKLERISSLEQLTLRLADISDLAPLAALNSLEEITLLLTTIRDLSPLTNLNSLSSLNLVHSRIPDLTVLAESPTLRNLTIQGYSVPDLAQVGALTSLNSLTIYVERDTREIDLSSLVGLYSLEYLKIYNGRIVDLAPLLTLANLKGLTLSAAGLTDISPLAELASLETLNLANNDIFDISPLANLKSLKFLKLDNTSIGDLSSIANLAALVHLSIDETEVSDLSPLVRLESLVRLSCRGLRVVNLHVLSGRRSIYIVK